MTRAGGVFWLYALLAALGATVTGLALFAATASVRWDTPSLAELVAACRSFALPDATTTSGLALVLGGGAFAVLALGARSAGRQVVASQRYLRELEVVGPAPFGTPRTFIYRDDAPQAFCVGFLRPRIFVSTATLRALTDDELEAVLAHESHHARCRDPLRLLIARTTSDALFFLPGMREIASRHAGSRKSPPMLPQSERAVAVAGRSRPPCSPSSRPPVQQSSVSCRSESTTSSVTDPPGNYRSPSSPPRLSS